MKQQSIEEHQLLHQDQQLNDVEIYSDEEYFQQKDKVDNDSDQQLSRFGNNWYQQQAYIEAKYQKYKMLRKELQQKQSNQFDNKSVSSQYSSFSGSSLSNLSSSSEGHKSNQNGIPTQNLQMIANKFQIMQRPRQDMNSETMTFKRIGEQHDYNQEFIEVLFTQWKKDASFFGRLSDKSKQPSQNLPSERISLVPTEQMLNKQRAKAIEQILTQNPYLTQHQIFLQLNKMNNLKVIKYGKYRQISRTIVNKLLNDGPFTQRRLRVLNSDRNSQQNVEMRHMFCRQLLKRYHNEENAIFYLDEHNFQLFQARDCIWVRPDQTSSNRQQNRRHQFSLLALFDIKGNGAYWKISNNCRQKYDDVEGFQNLLQQAMQFIDERDSGNLRIKDETILKTRKINRKVYLVMDSIIFSNKIKVKKYEQIAKGKILFCPPSSPQLNPIEEWFTQLRLKIRASTYSTNQDLYSGVDCLLREYQTYDFKGIIQEAIHQIERGERRDRF